VSTSWSAMMARESAERTSLSDMIGLAVSDAGSVLLRLQLPPVSCVRRVDVVSTDRPTDRRDDVASYR